MVPAIDVKHINPFLQSSISIVESVTQVKLTVGKPEMTDFHLHDKYYAIQVGVVGEMNPGEQCKGYCIPYDVRNASE